MANRLTYTFLCCLLTVWSVMAVDIPGVQPTEMFDHSQVLDSHDSYIMFWKYNDTHVTFEVHAKTFGYVGFGISTNGDMVGSDVVIGWISNGTTHFADRHATDRVMPVMDTHQDWHLLHAEENDFGTVLKFVRKIDTCDTAEDVLIQTGTVRIIYSYHDTDPISDDDIPYHGAITRGTKSVWLLGAIHTSADIPANVQYFDFLNKNAIIMPKKTYYHCTAFQMPDLGGKHHMIKYEPVITPGNEAFLHHILIFRCPGVDPSVNGMHGDCDSNMWEGKHQCGDAVVAWAVGGEPFYFPHNTGYSFNDAGEPTFFFMQTHYDNPAMKSGVIDNSGIRITLTKDLRAIDVGMLEMGIQSNFHLVVPPNQAAFVSKSFCSETCLNDAFAQAQLSEINVFAGLQHSHLLGVAITTRHFRNGTEIKPLMTDPNYDFDFQEMRVMKEVTVKAGDSFELECTYDSRGLMGPTFGGQGTHDEMCLDFLYYYPRLPVAGCLSMPVYDLGSDFNNTAIYNRFHSMDWDNSTVVADYKTELANSRVYHYCYGSKFHDPDQSFAAHTWVERETAHPYVPPPRHCS